MWKFKALTFQVENCNCAHGFVTYYFIVLVKSKSTCWVFVSHIHNFIEYRRRMNMDYHSYRKSLPIFLFTIFFIFVELNLIAHGQDDPGPCSDPSWCGPLFPKLSYPFWGGKRPQSCSEQGFKLDCHDGSYATIEMEDGLTYRVLNVYGSNHTMKLAREDLWENHQLCSELKYRKNTSLNTELFNYTPNLYKLTLFYDCNYSSIFDKESSCPSGYPPFFPREVIRDPPSGLICGSSIQLPVLQPVQNWDHLFLALTDGFIVEYHVGKQGKGKWKPKAKIGISISAIGAVLIIILAFLVWRKYLHDNSLMFWKRKPENNKSIEVFLENFGSLHPKRFSYSDVKKINNSYKDKLGEGGFGGVYRGKLRDGRLVAVKVLNTLKGSGEDFINEVSSISRTSHINVVTLLGFCFEGHKRALVYEFMPNGSLEKFIYQKIPVTSERQLNWKTLYQIAVGIARGLEYLHRGCNTRILHFDIKPHNILLDEEFIPKISDFGLAKICPQKESIVSMLGARGTPGYIAPEVFSRNFGGVSHKSDVYSYGMMVLEMVGGRRNIECGADRTSELYFPHWIYKRLELHQELGLQGIVEEDEKEKARKMIIVSMWCIQTNPSNRPPMSRVVEMLEGGLQSLQIPPQPFLSSPPRSPAADSPFMASSSSSVI